MTPVGLAARAERARAEAEARSGLGWARSASDAIVLLLPAAVAAAAAPGWLDPAAAKPLALKAGVALAGLLAVCAGETPRFAAPPRGLRTAWLAFMLGLAACTAAAQSAAGALAGAETLACWAAWAALAARALTRRPAGSRLAARAVLAVAAGQAAAALLRRSHAGAEFSAAALVLLAFGSFGLASPLRAGGAFVLAAHALAGGPETLLAAAGAAAFAARRRALAVVALLGCAALAAGQPGWAAGARALAATRWLGGGLGSLRYALLALPDSGWARLALEGGPLLVAALAGLCAALGARAPRRRHGAGGRPWLAAAAFLALASVAGAPLESPACLMLLGLCSAVLLRAPAPAEAPSGGAARPGALAAVLLCVIVLARTARAGAAQSLLGRGRAALAAGDAARAAGLAARAEELVPGDFDAALMRARALGALNAGRAP